MKVTFSLFKAPPSPANLSAALNALQVLRNDVLAVRALRQPASCWCVGSFPAWLLEKEEEDAELISIAVSALSR